RRIGSARALAILTSASWVMPAIVAPPERGVHSRSRESDYLNAAASSRMNASNVRGSRPVSFLTVSLTTAAWPSLTTLSRSVPAWALPPGQPGPNQRLREPVARHAHVPDRPAEHLRQIPRVFRPVQRLRARDRIDVPAVPGPGQYPGRDRSDVPRIDGCGPP